MRIRSLHPWNLTPREAIALQDSLRRRIRITPLPLRPIRLVAGCDIAVSKEQGILVGAVVVMDRRTLETVEVATAWGHISFPYVPGLLSFRETPVLIAAFRRLRRRAQAVLCDGQGIAHPRRLGLASHLGLILGVPTVGCAKSLLVGEPRQDLGAGRGSYTSLYYQGDKVGIALRTRPGVKPIYVSPGHMADFDGSRHLVLACLSQYRLPEPTRRAHMEAGREKRILERGGIE